MSEKIGSAMGLAAKMAYAASRASTPALPKCSVLHLGKFYSPHPGGMETHLKTLCHQLSCYLNVRALVCGDRILGRERADGPVRVTESGCWLNLWGAPLAPGIVGEVWSAKEELFHVHWPNPAAALAYLAAGRKRPLVITWHSDVVRQKRLGIWFDPLLRRFLDLASAVIVSSPRYADDSQALSRFGSRVRVVPFGIDPDTAARCDIARVRELRERYGQRIVLSVGRLVYYKGLDHLIRAVRDIPKATLVIVGSGPLRSYLENEARLAGVRERVVFTGLVKDVAPYYHACDVFVLPSVARSEAFGLVQLEAMAAGKPVVNTALRSGVPFVSLDGVTGLTVPPADPAALARAVNRLLDDSTVRGHYGNGAIRRVRQEFSLDLMTRRTLDIYDEVLEMNELKQASNYSRTVCARLK